MLFKRREYVRKKYKESAEGIYKCIRLVCKGGAKHIVPNPKEPSIHTRAFTVSLQCRPETGEGHKRHLDANWRSNLFEYVRLDEDYADALYR